MTATAGEPTAEPGIALSPKLTTRIKATAGAGQLVESVSTTVFSTFLFFYYTALLGVPGSLVGAATAISLVADAIADPLLGSLSDNARSRWGRRIPFMVIGGPLVALGLGLVFSPPAGLSTLGLFGWLVTMSLLMRFAISTFHVPFLALGAELSSDYVERSDVVTYRTLFSIFGPLSVLVLGYGVFLGGAEGLRHAPGYAPLAWSAAALILVGSLVAVAGVRRFAGTLTVAARDKTALHRRLFEELMEIFKNPSFRVMFSCAVLFSSAQGLAASLSGYLFVFVWQISSPQILLITVSVFVGLMAGVPLAPILGRRLEKKVLVITGLAMFCLAQGGLSSLWALGLYAPTGADVVLPLCLNSFIAGVGLTFTTIAIGSMMADATDEHDFLFGTRREGLFFAGIGFAQKAATGLGALLAGIALDVIHFPQMAAAQGVAAHLTPAMLNNLVWASGPTAAAVSLVATGLMFLYRIDRRRHAEIAKALQARKLVSA